MLNESEPHARLLEMLMGCHVYHAICAAARLGIADLLAEQPRTAEQLAVPTRTFAPALYRLLRALAGLGVLRAEPDGRFALTPLGETLRADSPTSVKALALLFTEGWYTQGWANILDSLHTGEPAVPALWTLLQSDSETGRIFDEAMTARSRIEAPAILTAYDFSEIRSLVDVAGGKGLLLRAILERYPEMNGALFDLPRVIGDVAAEHSKAAPGERCRLVAGDFFDWVPPADAYLLKHIIHDWADTDAIRIFSTCRRSIQKNGRVLVVDVVINEAANQSFGKLHDLEMMIFPGGRERTEREFCAVLDAAGFRLVRVIPTVAPDSIVEAVPK